MGLCPNPFFDAGRLLLEDGCHKIGQRRIPGEGRPGANPFVRLPAG